MKAGIAGVTFLVCVAMLYIVAISAAFSRDEVSLAVVAGAVTTYQ